jgi:L-asparaginase
MNSSKKTRIAHLSGPTATIQNTPPLVTSNKARSKLGLPLLTDVDGAPLRHDALRPQRLAAPTKVYVERLHRRRRRVPQGAPQRRRQAGL